MTTTQTSPVAVGDDLVAMARRTRESAEAFRRTVERFGREMPGHLDRFHDVMRAFRTTARDLQGGTRSARPVLTVVTDTAEDDLPGTLRQAA